MNYIITAVVSIVIVSSSFGIGFKLGSDSKEFQLELQYLQEQTKLITQYRTKEKQYQDEVSKLSTQILSDKENYNTKLAELTDSYDSRLSESNRRAEYYRQKSKDSCSDLSAHTARLDKALTEGILLVRELTEHIKLRDNQLKRVGDYLNLENKLHE